MSDKTSDRFVYGIFEIEDGKETPCYIGMGKEARMYSHLKAARRGNLGKRTFKDLYLFDAVNRGVEFIERKIIENLTVAEARKHEARLIKEIGCLEYETGPLLNICGWQNRENVQIKNFTIDEACHATGMSRNSIYKLIREGKLKPSSPCGRKLIAREQLLKVLADSEGKESPSGRGHNAKAAIEARWHGKGTAVAAKKRQAAK